MKRFIPVDSKYYFSRAYWSTWCPGKSDLSVTQQSAPYRLGSNYEKMAGKRITIITLVAAYCISYATASTAVGSPVTDGDTVIQHRDRRVEIFLSCPRLPADPSLVGSIVIKSTYPTHFDGLCFNGVFNFTTVNPGLQRLRFSILPEVNRNDKCILHDLHNGKTYSMSIKGGWGTREQLVITKHLHRTIICAYDMYTVSDKHYPVTLEEYVLAPKSITQYLTQLSTYMVQMSVVNSMGETLDGRRASIGTFVKLRAHVRDYATNKHTIIQALSCYAENSKGYKYYILRRGCGDGLVLGKEAGFTFYNGTRVAVSEIFEIFRLPHAYDIYFVCHFLVCESNCPLGSCKPLPKGRYRRSSDILPGRGHTTLTTGYIFLNGVVSPEQPTVEEQIEEVAPKPSNIRDPQVPWLKASHCQNKDSIIITAVLAVFGTTLFVAITILLFVRFRKISPRVETLPNIKLISCVDKKLPLTNNYLEPAA